MKIQKREPLQQGDVLFTPLSTMPSGEKKNISKGRCVLAHGESGHSHVLDEDEEDAELIQMGERMLLNLRSTATVVHEEHKPITLEPGLWEIGRVNEYDYFSKMIREVVD